MMKETLHISPTTNPYNALTFVLPPMALVHNL